MSTEVKQEGDFKLKTKPKKLVPNTEDPIKVDLSAKNSQGEVVEETTKVVIKNEENDAVQTQKTDGSDVAIEEPKDSGDSEKVVEEVRTAEEGIDSPLQEIIDEENKPEVKEPVISEKPEESQLPENIEKLVAFMEETGGTIEDYTRLNADYSSIDDITLLKEYYKKHKPYLDNSDVDLLLEDFSYDEELDEPKEIRKRKIAFKEEVAKAKIFLEETKSKYYDEIKLRPGVTQEQQKAMDFFNRYNESQKTAAQNYEIFKEKTNNLFSEEFKGFEFSLANKKFNYSISNPKEVADTQSDINNIVGKFLAKNGTIKDAAGYHKAMFAASNADKIANHFYEQGKADAIKDVVSKSKNPSMNTAREAPKDVYINGLKVKAISGTDSSKLKIKTKRFN
jgi:hypothetical protein